ncbi:IS5 family transposase (plasmid) [Rhizobium ruizarguesonis]|nr:IS5 family transposase [Rhizobium ruizarguesonis]WSH23716.1 IS5 family transposase [Rhizobium ruizarguesonis]WSH37111.1 IS5 family transposase [Rhizobium ruizarguesonis]
MARGDLSDAEWHIVGPFLPSERGRKSRPAQDNRRYLNGMLHVLRVGCPWRDMHERYGKWNSVYVRFRRWAEQGIWDALLETLVELGLTDDWQHMLDSTIIRGHSQAAGAKGGDKEAFGRSRGGFTTKIHARADGQARPLGFILTGGEVSDYKAVPQLLAIPVSRPRKMLADKGYDADAVREEPLLHGTRPVIPPRSTRKHPPPCDYNAYKDRNRIERMFNRLKQFRRISTRYDKTKVSFAGFLALASVKMWLPVMCAKPF